MNTLLLDSSNKHQMGKKQWSWLHASHTEQKKFFHDQQTAAFENGGLYLSFSRTTENEVKEASRYRRGLLQKKPQCLYTNRQAYFAV